MAAAHARPRTPDRVALAVLCLLLAGSVALKIRAHQSAPDASAPVGEVADLGGGATLPRGEVARRTVWVAGCREPVAAEAVDPSPHGEDGSLAAPPSPGDRVFYAYRGRTLGGRFAVAELAMLHFGRRALGVLGMGADAGRRELSIKLTLPASCHASAEDVMAALRRDGRW